MSDDIYVEEVPEPEVSTVDRVKNWVKKYETPLACAATGAFVFGVTYRALGIEIDNVKFSKAVLESEFDELGFENLALHDFIETKNLKAKFDTFFQTQVEQLDAAA